jgi:alpha-tubulin suppressor-like RCC1 family protein
MLFLNLPTCRTSSGSSHRRRILVLAVVLSLLLGALSTVFPVIAQGESSNQIYDWGNTSKGGPQCKGALCYAAPQPVSGLSNVVAIDAGNSFNLAILSDGSVMAWGQNQDGQLGNGTTSQGFTPPGPVIGLSNVVQTVDGNNDALALLSNGTVMAWGNNQSGQLGNGTKQNASVPEPVPGLSGVVELAAGGNHAYALLSNGTIMAWGAGSYGQLGDHSTKNRTTPVMVSGISTAVAVTSGNLFGGALLSDGTVLSWGYNAFGQLGNGTTQNSTVPVPVMGLTGVTELSYGGNVLTNGHSMALLTDGTVETWGCNTNGQLGNGTEVNSSVPVPVAGLSMVTDIEAGGAHSMALLADGTVMTWGSNQQGQLGNMTLQQGATPMPVMMNAVMISAGSEHSLAAQ